MIKESYYLATRQFNPFYSPSRTLLKTEDEIIDFVKNNLPNGKVGILLSSGRDSCSLADLSLNTIMRVESGVNKNPTIETLTKIAKALDVGVDDLIN